MTTHPKGRHPGAVWKKIDFKLEQQLNQQVYAPYALTPEEIQII